MTERKQPAPHSLLLIAYFIFFVMAIPVGVLNIAWTSMQATFNVSLDSLGILLFGSTCGSLLGNFFSGRLIGSFGVGRYLIVGAVVMMLGLLGYATAPTWFALIASVFTTSLGFSFFNAGLNIFVSARYSAGQFNWLHACFGVGQMVGPALATIIITQWGQSWHVPYLAILILLAVVTALLLFTRDRWIMPGDAEITRSHSSPRAGLVESLRIPAVLLGMGLFFCTSGVIGSTGQLSNTLLTVRGIEGAGFWVSFYWASFTLGRIVMGFIAHRLDNAMLIRFGLLGAALGTLLLWQTAIPTLNLLGLALIGLSCAPMYPTLIAETHRRVAQPYRANAIGFEMASAGLGQSLVPGFIAWLAQRTSLDVIAPLLLVGVLLALALSEVAARRRVQAVTAAA